MQRDFMQHATMSSGHDDDELVSLSKAARRVGVCCSTLSRQIHAGKIRSHDGKVRISEVIEDRQRNLNGAVWEGRRRALLGIVSTSDLLHADAFPVRHATAALDATLYRDDAPREHEDAPLGPRPFHIGANGDVLLTRGLVRQLGELIGSEDPGDPPLVAYDLATTTIDILQQEIVRLKAKAGEGDE